MMPKYNALNAIDDYLKTIDDKKELDMVKWYLFGYVNETVKIRKRKLKRWLDK